MTPQKFSLTKRFQSIRYATDGIRYLIRYEHNIRIHILAALCSIVLGLLLKLSIIEWISICFSIGLVFVMESINSAIESLADFISPQKNGEIKIIKDISAAAVLLSALTAISVGLIVFLPKIIKHV
jgi:diacylglycerol kinase